MLLVAAFALVGGACSSVSADSDEATPGDEISSASTQPGSSEDPDSAQQSVANANYKDFVDIGDISDPIEDDLVFACNGLVASASDLVATFAADPISPTVLANRMSGALDKADFAGDPSSWAQLETGWLIDREPLTTAPESFIVLGPDGSMFPCAFRRAGYFDERPVAWEYAEDGTVWIESCIDPDTVVVDSRELDGATVVTLFAPSVAVDEVLAEEPDCAVDGTTTLDLEADNLLSGSSFPFVAPDALSFQLLAPHRKVADLPELSGEIVQCSVVGKAGGVDVTWTALPAGYSAAIVSGDETITTIRARRFEVSSTVQTVVVERLSTYAVVQSGEAELSRYLDPLAPSKERSYILVALAEGERALSSDCGSAGSQNFGGAGEQVGDVAQGDLANAAGVFSNNVIGPYAYLTATAICDGCGSESFQLGMVPGGSYGHEFSPSLDDQTGNASGGILNPFGIYEILSSAEQDGKDVEYIVDPLVGVVVSYTIDGVGAKISCFEVDTAPSDLREGVACNPEWDLLSSN